MWAGKQLLLGQKACRMVQIERMTCAKEGKSFILSGLRRMTFLARKALSFQIRLQANRPQNGLVTTSALKSIFV